MGIDRTMNNLENELSKISAYPVIGTVAGTAKFAMGLTQSLTALVCGILSIAPAAVIRDWKYANRSWTHFKHGFGNMLAGTIEAIPGVQTLVYVIRKIPSSVTSDLKAHLYTNHENKFMPYKSLIERDFTIDGCDDDEVERVKAIFNQKINDAGRKLTPKEKFKLAKDAVNGK